MLRLKVCRRTRQAEQYVPAVNSRTRGSQWRGHHGFPQHTLQHAPNSLGDQLVALCSGVDAVDLIETRPRGDVFKQKRNQLCSVLVGEVRIRRFELLNVS